MATRFLALAGGERPAESRELAFDLRHNRFLESRLRRSPRCRFDHCVVREIAAILAEARIADLVDLVECRFGTRAVHLEGRRQAANGGFAGTRFLPVEALRERGAEPLAALGLGPGMACGCDVARKASS